MSASPTTPLPSQQAYKLALVQMTVVGGEPETNLKLAETKIEEASDNGALVVLLPEALDLGWTDPSAKELAQPIPEGTPYKRLAAAAKAHSVYVCAGLVERSGETIYNSAVLINPEGEMLLKHRKINEVAPGTQFYAKGGQLAVAETPLGKVGVMICADAFIEGQVISRSLAAMGAQIILSPCSWAVGGDHDNNADPYGGLWLHSYGVVAKDFNIWIAGASNVGQITGGPWSGMKCIGCSMVISPGGEPLFVGPYGDTADQILYAAIPV